MRYLGCLTALATIFASGCTDFRDYTDSMLLGSRNSHLAQVSWARNKAGVCQGRENVRDFRDGYLEGYTTVAGGGRPCAPALPPRRYWAACYQSTAGRAKINAWYAGFQEGITAAERDGVGNLSVLPTLCGTNAAGCGCDEKPAALAQPLKPSERPRRRGDPPKRAVLPPAEPRPPLAPDFKAQPTPAAPNSAPEKSSPKPNDSSSPSTGSAQTVIKPTASVLPVSGIRPVTQPVNPAVSENWVKATPKVQPAARQANNPPPPKPQPVKSAEKPKPVRAAAKPVEKPDSSDDSWTTPHDQLRRKSPPRRDDGEW
jgi:hypothetical protein